MDVNVLNLDMNKYNGIQKISLIIGITTFIAWLLFALDDGMLRHGLFDLGDGFDDPIDILLFSLACGSYATFYLFKDGIEQESDQPKEEE